MRCFPIIIGLLITLILLLCCHSKEEQRISATLRIADTNRQELEDVLLHYQGNEMKLAAARYLVANMSGHFGVSDETCNKITPVYNIHQRISEKYDWIKSIEWGSEIDSLEKASFFLQPQYIKDVNEIKSEWLIKHIDLSFKIWKNNYYTNNFPFSLFCKYILPHRLTNGINIDSDRELIYNRHKNLVQTQYTEFFEEAIDSLLCLYKDITYNMMYGVSIPIYSFQTLEQIKSSNCSDRCWFNEILFNALGFPVSTDFIPNWGNRNSSHSWNVLVTPDTIYPFAALWEKDKIDRWKYKELYKNLGSDHQWGKFRLSKVYRKTYSISQSPPLTSLSVKRNEIPPFFRNPWMEDVSEQYFDTTNVHISLPKFLSKEVKSCYLCTYDYQKWTPVQWGSIKNGQAIFWGMGRDVLYLPAYYHEGKEFYINSPFWLKSDGQIQFLKKQFGVDTLYIRRTEGVWLFDEIEKNRRTIQGLIIMGLNSESRKYDTLCIVNNHPDMELNTYTFKQGNYKKFRLVSQNDTLAFNEMSFNGCRNSVSVHAIADNGHTLQNYGFDNRSETAFFSVRRKEKKHIVDVELEKETELISISLRPYTQNLLKPTTVYELFYWENGWKSFGVKKGNPVFQVWENVPRGCLFLLKNKDKKNDSGERPFVYKNGIVSWL